MYEVLSFSGENLPTAHHTDWWGEILHTNFNVLRPDPPQLVGPGSLCVVTSTKILLMNE